MKIYIKVFCLLSKFKIAECISRLNCKKELRQLVWLVHYLHSVANQGLPYRRSLYSVCSNNPSLKHKAYVRHQTVNLMTVNMFGGNILLSYMLPTYGKSQDSQLNKCSRQIWATTATSGLSSSRWRLKVAAIKCSVFAAFSLLTIFQVFPVIGKVGIWVSIELEQIKCWSLTY